MIFLYFLTYRHENLKQELLNEKAPKGPKVFDGDYKRTLNKDESSDDDVDVSIS